MKKKLEEWDGIEVVKVTPEMGENFYRSLTGLSGKLEVDRVVVLGDKRFWVPLKGKKYFLNLTYPDLEVVNGKGELKEIVREFMAHEAGEYGGGSVLSPRSTTGCDPEIFVEGSKGIIPAWEFLPAKNSGMGHFWDGFQAEFTPAAAGCLETLAREIRQRLSNILYSAKRHDTSAQFTLKNVVEVPEHVLNTAEMKYVELGCAPSLNVYKDRGKEIVNPRELKVRFAGGHLHYGGQFKPKQVEELVRALDAILGVAGVSMAQDMDDPVRREYYGRAGEFRLPKHGIEYRVLSNFWLIHPAISMVVMELFRVVVRLVQTGLFKHVWTWDEDAVRETINTCDVKRARKMLLHNAKNLEALFCHSNFGSSSSGITKRLAEAATYVVLNGVEKVVKKNLSENWGVKGEGEQWGTSYPKKWVEFVKEHPKRFAQDAKGTVTG